jgi:hypothetical protein
MHLHCIYCRYMQYPLYLVSRSTLIVTSSTSGTHTALLVILQHYLLKLYKCELGIAIQ